MNVGRSIVNGWLNVFKEQGYTKGDFAMDIAFGDPKEIGGVNSIVENYIMVHLNFVSTQAF